MSWENGNGYGHDQYGHHQQQQQYEDFTSGEYTRGDELNEIFSLFAEREQPTDKLKLKDLPMAVRAAGAAPSEQEMKGIVNDYMRSNRMMLSFQDFQALVGRFANRKLLKPAEVSEVFRLFDTNYSGQMTSVEIMRILSTQGERLEQEDLNNIKDMIQQNARGGMIQYADFFSEAGIQRMMNK
eukprot:tig00000310_g23999.t1